jgi:hypothetical protein
MQLICQRAAKGEARPEARWYSAAGEQLESDWTGGDVEELEAGIWHGRSCSTKSRRKGNKVPLGSGYKGRPFELCSSTA